MRRDADGGGPGPAVPNQFAKLSRKEILVFGILVATSAASILVAFSYFHFPSVFTDVVLLTVLTAVIPYLYSAAAHLYWLIIKGRAVNMPQLVRDIAVTVVALAFTFWALDGTGYQVAYYRIFVFFLGIPVYVWMKAQRGEFGESPVTPIDYPAGSPYAAAAAASTSGAPANGNGHVNGKGALAPVTAGIVMDAGPRS